MFDPFQVKEQKPGQKPWVPRGTGSLRPFFEGNVNIKVYGDRVSVDGKCFNCRSHVTQIVSVPDPIMRWEMQKEGSPAWAQVRALAVEFLMDQHQCSIQFEGKTDAEEICRHLRGDA